MLESNIVRDNIAWEDRPDVYLDGMKVEYKEFDYERHTRMSFLDPYEPPKPAQIRIVLRSGQVINVSTEDERWTFVTGQRARLDLSIG